MLVFFGSPRENGFTRKALTSFLDSLPKNARVDIIDAYRENVRPCTACGACAADESCAFRDCDVIFDKLENADILVFASPVYNLGFPAPLKAIIDRMQVFYNRRFVHGVRPPVKKPKKGFLIATAGSERTDGAEYLEKQLKTLFTVLNTTMVSVRAVTGTDKESSKQKGLVIL